MRLLSLLVLSSLAAGCDRGPLPATSVAPPPEVKESPPQSRPKATSRSNPSVVPPPAAVAKTPSFDAVIGEVVERGKRLDAAEPAETEAAIKLLTAPEAGEARLYMKAGLGPRATPEIARLGLTSWLARQSRALATAEREPSGFRAVARVAWMRGYDSSAILGLMNQWGLIEAPARDRATAAILESHPASKLDAETRDVVVRLLGAEWFTRMK